MHSAEIHLELKDNNVLLISGERLAKHEEGSDGENKWHRIERSYGKFSRAFHLPDNSDLDSISAEFRAGELMVTVPKAAVRPAKNRRIVIQSSAPKH